MSNSIKKGTIISRGEKVQNAVPFFVKRQKDIHRFLTGLGSRVTHQGSSQGSSKALGPTYLPIFSSQHLLGLKRNQATRWQG